jgi:hypothetical protein
MATHKAHGNPTKDFFVHTITKDVSIEDCILDLLDNSIDGARKVSVQRDPAVVRIDDYSDFRAELTTEARQFVIKDNCGGISIGEAIDDAFHFGRRADAPAGAGFSIGLYGIGMKRAIFKLGQTIEIYSSTQTEAFYARINVPAWLSKPADDWEFDLEDAAVIAETGTKIEVRDLNPTVTAAFEAAAFRNGLARIIGRDYFQFLNKGFRIELNGLRVPSYAFTIRESADFQPVHLTYTDGDVEVEIIAGMAGPPPDDLEPSEALPETDYFGWFVLCNDRVVVPSDKTGKTVWGNEGFPVWHYQYNGFIGMVSFHARDAKLLPWTTTKRDIDQTSVVFRRAVGKMKETTRPWINYTSDRKADLERAKASEATAAAKPIFDTAVSARPQFPQGIQARQATTISYSKPLKEVRRVKTALGNANMSNRDAGAKTFDYFAENELGDE